MSQTIGVDLRSLQTPYRTGVGEYVYELMTALLQEDEENRYVFWTNGNKTHSAQIPEVQKHAHHHTRIPNKILHGSLALFGLPKIDRLVAGAAQITSLNIFFSPNPHFTSLGKKVKHVLVVHDISFLRYPHFFPPLWRLGRRLYRLQSQIHQAAAVITPSVFVQEELIREFQVPREKVHVVSPGISPVFFDPAFSSAAHLADVRARHRLPEKFILFLGTIEPRKNIPAIIEAFSHLKERKEIPDDLGLVIAGAPGWLYADIMRSFSRHQDIRYIHYVPSEDRPALYSLAELFVYPSLYEGFGLPVLEAFACGVPVITSNRSSLPEVAERGALLIDPNRIDDIAEAIIRGLYDIPLREELIRFGKQRLVAYSWERAAKNLKYVFGKLA